MFAYICVCAHAFIQSWIYLLNCVDLLPGNLLVGGNMELKVSFSVAVVHIRRGLLSCNQFTLPPSPPPPPISFPPSPFFSGVGGL